MKNSKPNNFWKNENNVHLFYVILQIVYKP